MHWLLLLASILSFSFGKQTDEIDYRRVERSPQERSQIIHYLEDALKRPQSSVTIRINNEQINHEKDHHRYRYRHHGRSSQGAIGSYHSNRESYNDRRANRFESTSRQIADYYKSVWEKPFAGSPRKFFDWQFLRSLKPSTIHSLADWLEILGSIGTQVPGMHRQVREIIDRLAELSSLPILAGEDVGRRAGLSARIALSIQNLLKASEYFNTAMDDDAAKRGCERQVWNALLIGDIKKAQKLFTQSRKKDATTKLLLNLLHHHAVHHKALMAPWPVNFAGSPQSKLAILEIIHRLHHRNGIEDDDNGTLQFFVERAKALLGIHSNKWGGAGFVRKENELARLYVQNRLCSGRQGLSTFADLNMPEASASLGLRITLAKANLEALCGSTVNGRGMSTREALKYYTLADREHSTGHTAYIHRTKQFGLLAMERIYEASTLAGLCNLAERVFPYVKDMYEETGGGRPCKFNDQDEGNAGFPEDIYQALTASNYERAEALWHRRYPQVDLRDASWNTGNHYLRRAAIQLFVILACKHPALLFHQSVWMPSPRDIRYNLAMAIGLDETLKANLKRPKNELVLTNEGEDGTDWARIYAMAGNMSALERLAPRVNPALMEALRGYTILHVLSRRRNNRNSSRTEVEQEACKAAKHFAFAVKRVMPMAFAQQGLLIAQSLCEGQPVSAPLTNIHASNPTSDDSSAWLDIEVSGDPLRLKLGLVFSGDSLRAKARDFRYRPLTKKEWLLGKASLNQAMITESLYYQQHGRSYGVRGGMGFISTGMQQTQGYCCPCSQQVLNSIQLIKMPKAKKVLPQLLHLHQVLDDQHGSRSYPQQLKVQINQLLEYMQEAGPHAKLPPEKLQPILIQLNQLSATSAFNSTLIGAIQEFTRHFTQSQRTGNSSTNYAAGGQPFRPKESQSHTESSKSDNSESEDDSDYDS